MKDRVDLLVDVLFDPSSREDEKGDAVIELGRVPDRRALKALFKFASNQNKEVDILEDCGNSIGRIFLSLNEFDEEMFKLLLPFVQKTVFQYIASHKPELIKLSTRKNFPKDLK